MNLSVIVITYYSKFLLLDLINNLTDKVKFSEIIIVNTSNENLTDIVLTYPFIKVFMIPNNGYGDAVNYGVKKAKYNNVLILNPDIKIKNFNVWKTDFTYFIIGGVKNNEIKYHPKWPTLSNSLIRFLLIKIHHLLGQPFFNLFFHKTIIKEANNIISVNWVYGDLILSNKQTFEKLNYFDTSFFLFYEETDFCLRANKIEIPVLKSKEIIYEDLSKVKSSSIKVEDIKIKEELKSLFYFFHKHLALSDTITLKYTLLISYKFYCIFFFCLSIFGKNFRRKYKEFKLRLYTLLEIWKQHNY